MNRKNVWHVKGDEMKVLVCGGRDYNDYGHLKRVMSNFVASRGIDKEEIHIIHGGALGADSMAEFWANENGIKTLVFQADWTQHGKAAGPIRNRQMLNVGPDIVIAFPGGPGTENMIELAKEAGIKVIQSHGRR